MTQLALLALWMTVGLAASAVWSDPDQHHRLAWAPLASILGPLWVLVAVDQRHQAGKSSMPARTRGGGVS